MSENQENLPAETGAKIPALINVVEGRGLVPQNFEGFWRLANIMSGSGFVPRDIAGKPEAVFVCLQFGAEVGLSPMQSVQNIAVVNGRPSIWGDAMIGLVEASGKLEELEEKIEGEGPDAKAVCIVKRKGRKNPVERSFSMADAQTAGLAGKSGPWAQYPKRMLQLRARSWALRDAFADVLKGLYSREEAADIIDITPTASGRYEAKPEPKIENVEVETDEPKADPRVGAFDEMVGDANDDPLFPVFLEKAAEANGMTVDVMKAEAVKDDAVDDLVAGFDNWKAAQKTKSKPVEPKQPLAEKPTVEKQKYNKNNDLSNTEKQADEPDFRSEWINLKAAGFSTFFHKNLDRFKTASKEIKKEAWDKWQKLYPETPWPWSPNATDNAPNADTDAEIVTTGAGLRVRKSELMDEVLNGPEWSELMDVMKAHPEAFKRAVGNRIFENYADVETTKRDTLLCAGVISTDDGIPQG
jgi:hypothetical protein